MFCSETDLQKCMQDELLGLPEDRDAGYKASHIDPDVLFRQSEMRQVPS